MPDYKTLYDLATASPKNEVLGQFFCEVLCGDWSGDDPRQLSLGIKAQRLVIDMEIENASLKEKLKLSALMRLAHRAIEARDEAIAIADALLAEGV